MECLSLSSREIENFPRRNNYKSTLAILNSRQSNFPIISYRFFPINIGISVFNSRTVFGEFFKVTDALNLYYKISHVGEGLRKLRPSPTFENTETKFILRESLIRDKKTCPKYQLYNYNNGPPRESYEWICGGRTSKKKGFYSFVAESISRFALSQWGEQPEKNRESSQSSNLYVETYLPKSGFAFHIFSSTNKFYLRSQKIKGPHKRGKSKFFRPFENGISFDPTFTLLFRYLNEVKYYSSISHKNSQWAQFPNYKIIPKYYPLGPDCR